MRSAKRSSVATRDNEPKKLGLPETHTDISSGLPRDRGEKNKHKGSGYLETSATPRWYGRTG